MRSESLIPLPDPEWISVLRAESAKPGRTKQQIAEELGVSRTAISLLCSGKYSARIDKVGVKIAALVVSRYAHQVWCQHVHAAIPEATCHEHAAAPMTMSDPVRLRQWAACRSCPINPVKTNEVKDAV